VESPVKLGICTDFNLENGEFTYIIGMEVTDFDAVPAELVCREFPEARYAVFNTPKVTPDLFSSSIQHTWRAIFEEWFPHSDYEHAGSAEFELYDERSHSDKNELVQMEIYIPIKER
jgi:AraC family transcriptional regulator